MQKRSPSWYGFSGRAYFRFSLSLRITDDITVIGICSMTSVRSVMNLSLNLSY